MSQVIAGGSGEKKCAMKSGERKCAVKSGEMSAAKSAGATGKIMQIDLQN